MGDPNSTESFHTQKSTLAVHITTIGLGLFGALMVFASFRTLSRLEADGVFLFVFGLAVIIFAVLFRRYLLNPPFELTDSEMRIRNLLGIKTYPYEEITSLGTYNETFRPRAGNGRRMRSVTVQKLEITLRSGKKKAHTLPGFIGNGALLASLSRRSKITVEKLPNIST